MIKYLKQIATFSLVFLITAILALPVAGMEKQTIGLLKVNNYSGVATVAGNKLENLVLDEFIKNIQKQESVQFIDHEKIKELMSANELESYYEAANLCAAKDLSAIGSKLGLTQLMILDINGYSEIKREKNKKSYQLLLGLYVINCIDQTEMNYSGEGFSDGARKEAFANSVSQLVNNYLSLGGEDPSLGSVRSYSVQVIGNKTSKMYHLLNTSHSPAEGNCEYFNSRTEAEEQQYSPCPICFPTYKSFSYSDRALEERLGSEGCGSIEYYYRVDNNPELIARVEKVAAPLIKDTYRKNVDYKFRILDTTEVNAFASPNGYIYITKGLLDIVESDDELAFVIAHEMGHIEKKHSVINYRRALAATFLSALFLASNENYQDPETALLTVVMTNMILKGYSREQENEADEVALSHLKRTGMDYLSFNMVMGKFIDMRQRKIWAIDKVFSTHPTPEKRIENLNQLLQAYDTLQQKINR
ncbi:MAG: M48 family metalloprotease [Firmicutes bacterium]|nr:M48 family metalloprotease [Bacillota bacterium]